MIRPQKRYSPQRILSYVMMDICILILYHKNISHRSCQITAADVECTGINSRTIGFSVTGLNPKSDCSGEHTNRIHKVESSIRLSSPKVSNLIGC